MLGLGLTVRDGWWRRDEEREEGEEMSVSFSVREEDEQQEAEAEEEENGGAKRGWPNERRWDGTEMGVDMDVDFFFLFLDHANPRRGFFFFDPANLTRRVGWMFFPFL